MDHANAIQVDADVADFTAGILRVLRALGRARRCTRSARANHADASDICTGARRSDIKGK
jgi:hypothetical protein